MKIALLHYSYPPVIGGVEQVLEQHALVFSENGHRVTVLCGAGESLSPKIDIQCIPELSGRHPLVVEAQRELAAGRAGEKCAELDRVLTEKLTPAIAQFDILFIYNVLTMPFNLCATALLWRLRDIVPGTRFVGWIHDIAAANPDYTFPFLDRPPWNLLVSAHPGIEYVAVSEKRRDAFLKTTGAPRCGLIPNGVNPLDLLQLTAPAARLARDEDLLEQDLVILHPARLLKRKNVELGIRAAHALAAKGHTCRYLVTGPPDPHNSASVAYAEFLHLLQAELGGPETVFVNDRFRVTTRDLASLYRLADILLLPSWQEGFGIPLLEAAVCGLPVACADIEPLRSLLPSATFFDPAIDPAALADLLLALARNSPTVQNRKFALREHSWDSVYTNHLQPLLARVEE